MCSQTNKSNEKYLSFTIISFLVKPLNQNIPVNIYIEIKHNTVKISHKNSAHYIYIYIYMQQFLL